MGISLTLAELKEYFQIWHKNNFDNLHSEEIQGYISNYLRDTGILNCGDKVRVTTCTSTGNNTTKVCDVTIVNNRITSTQVDFSNFI